MGNPLFPMEGDQPTGGMHIDLPTLEEVLAGNFGMNPNMPQAPAGMDVMGGGGMGTGQGMPGLPSFPGGSPTAGVMKRSDNPLYARLDAMNGNPGAMQRGGMAQMPIDGANVAQGGSQEATGGLSPQIQELLNAKNQAFDAYKAGSNVPGVDIMGGGTPQMEAPPPATKNMPLMKALALIMLAKNNPQFGKMFASAQAGKAQASAQVAAQNDKNYKKAQDILDKKFEMEKQKYVEAKNKEAALWDTYTQKYKELDDAIKNNNKMEIETAKLDAAQARAELVAQTSRANNAENNLSKRIAEEGKNDRWGTPSGNVLTQEAGKEGRWDRPSGNAQLSAETSTANSERTVGLGYANLDEKINNDRILAEDRDLQRAISQANSDIAAGNMSIKEGQAAVDKAYKEATIKDKQKRTAAYEKSVDKKGGGAGNKSAADKKREEAINKAMGKSKGGKEKLPVPSKMDTNTGTKK